MHWLTGSHEKDPIHKIWRYVGALDDTVKINVDEPFMVYDHGGTPIRLFRNVDETEKHLLALSPADAKEIKRLCNNIRKMKTLAMPVTDVRGVKVTKRSRLPLSLLFSGIAALRLVKSLTKISREQYIKQFAHEGIKDMLRSITTDDSGILPIVFTFGTLTRGDGGFPEGGSLPFAGRMVKVFTEAGGTIHCNTRAERVVVESGRATAVISGDKRFAADAVIVTADTMAIEHLFDISPSAPWLDEMRRVTKPVMSTFISLGIDADLRHYPNVLMFKTKEPVKLDTQSYEFLGVNNYAADPVYSPKGKSALTIQLSGDTYDYWKKAKDEGVYAEEKQKIADEVIAALTVQIPEARGKIEVVDVATPLTYERYCSNWKGSWMTEMTSGVKLKIYPAPVDNIRGVYFAGHRMMPPGGLPIALMSGREAVQYLCRDTDTLFNSEE